MSTSKRANYFTQIFSTVIAADPQEEEKETQDKDSKLKKLLSKVVPQQKTTDELFDSDRQISAGPMFEENFGAQQDESINILIDGKRMVNLKYPSTFQECNLSEEIIDNIRKKNYLKPTQIQKAIIPLVQRTKYDIIGHAQTGSGKTAAFLLPIINEIQKDYISGVAQFNRDSPYIIVTAPTRELVIQLYEDSLSLATGSSVKIAVAFGDVPMGYSIQKLREGCDILVATKGRLAHYIRQEIIRLNNVRYFVLDEADIFMQKQDNLDDIRFIKSKLLHEHRTFMLSATFEEQLRTIAKEFLQPIHCFVNVKEVNSAVNTVSQKIIPVNLYDKKKKLLELLFQKARRNIGPNSEIFYEVEKTIVFKNGKRECDRLGIALAYYGFRVITINSYRTQQQRMAAVEDFTKGKYDIIIGTDILARGMNFPNVQHVINYDMPRPGQCIQYIHRIGRTGRAGNLGRSTSFFDIMSQDCQSAAYLLDVLIASNQIVPEFLDNIVKHQNGLREENQTNSIVENPVNHSIQMPQGKSVSNISSVFDFW